MSHSQRRINHTSPRSSSLQSISSRSINSLKSLNPLLGINWPEIGRAYQVFIRHPDRGILHILAAGENSNWQQWAMKRLKHQAINLENAPLQINISQLQKLPADTLGGAYSRHITQQGFNPEAFIRPTDRHAWLNHRLALSHDVYHVITGFDGTPIGEFGLAAFGLVQYRDLLNTFVLSFVPWSMLGFPHQAMKMFMAVWQGFQMGRRCSPIIAYPFEKNWHKSLTEVRQELGISQ